MGRYSKQVKLSSRITKKELPPNFFSAFGKEARLKAFKNNRKLAKDISKQAKRVIRNQEFNWIPLDPEYVRSKERKGEDARIYMATRELVNKGIGWWVKDGFVFVGPREGIHKPSGLTYRHLTRILEFGTWNIPARPLWRPLISKALRENARFRKVYAKAVQKAVNKRVKRAKKLTRKS